MCVFSGSASGSNTASSNSAAVNAGNGGNVKGLVEQKLSNTSFIKPINTYPPLPELQDNTASSIITDILPQKSSTLKAFDLNQQQQQQPPPPRNKSAASTLSTGYTGFSNSSQHTSLVQRKSSTTNKEISGTARRDSDNMSNSQKLLAGTTTDSIGSQNQQQTSTPVRKVQTMPGNASFRSQGTSSSAQHLLRSPLSQRNSVSNQDQQKFVTQTTKAIPTLATQIVNL